MEEVDPETVGRMIEYIYTSDYCDGNRSGQAAAIVAPGEVLDDDAVGDENRSISKSQESIDQDDTTAIPDGVGQWLLNNVLVYAIAERYFIEGLKEMARVKFRSQAENLLSVKEFPEIIRELYQSTLSSDRGLRDIVSHICAQQGRIVVDRPDLSASIVENGEFGLDILREVLKNGDDREEEATTTNASLHQKVTKKEEQVAAIRTLLTKVVSDIKADKIPETRKFW